MPVTDPIRSKLGQLPHKPGIYLMKDRFGTVIYVGKALNLRKRVSQYFHPSRRQTWDLKLQALIDAIHDFDVHVVKSEPEALLLEGKLIKQFHPRYNVSFRDDKRFLLLKVNLNDPIPRFTLTRFKQEDGAIYFGPFAHAGALRGTLSMVRKKFNLRGCRPLTPTETDYKHCLYANLKFCTAPCIGNVTLGDYRKQVLAAIEFLSGQTQEMNRQLEEEMQQAAVALDFEKAAQLRDAIQALAKTMRRTEKFERLPYTLPLAIDPERDNHELARTLGLAAVPERIEAFDISNISGTLKVASIVSFRKGRPDRANYRRMRIKTVEGQDDFACVAEAVRRRYARLLREANGERDRKEEEGRAIVDELKTMVKETSQRVRRRIAPNDGVGVPPATAKRPSNLPDLIVIDGGKGQLNAAVAELATLGLDHIPIIGLAKEFEEIYRPGVSEPLRLSHDEGALKLLQRIRDESHRVANSYNAQLRLKKISESILDEFPGIGHHRKAALLKKFGSVQRLRTASVEEIAEVPGFGGKGAAELKTFLLARSDATHERSP